MREIEIKARVADKAKLVGILAEHGVTLTPPMTQHDRVYGVRGVSGASENSEPWLRIRQETAAGATTNYFTLKRSVTNQLDSIEHEVTVGDAEELERLILALDFVPYSDLTKIRQKAHLTDAIEICVDTVEPLGDFIEAEMLCADDADPEKVVAQLWDILAPYGVTREAAVTDGYDVLMNKYLGKQ